MGFFLHYFSRRFVMNIKKILILLPFCFSMSAFAMSTMSDSDITKSIDNQYKNESSLANSSLSVKTENHIVSISGSVNSDAQADTAIELAQATPGVKDVNVDYLKMNGDKYLISDAYITAKVKGMFLQEKIFTSKDVASLSVSVETNNGVVALSGKADNDKQIKNAIKIAESVSGVKSVTSNISISNN